MVNRTKVGLGNESSIHLGWTKDESMINNRIELQTFRNNKPSEITGLDSWQMFITLKKHY